MKSILYPLVSFEPSIIPPFISTSIYASLSFFFSTVTLSSHPFSLLLSLNQLTVCCVQILGIISQKPPLSWSKRPAAPLFFFAALVVVADSFDGDSAALVVLEEEIFSFADTVVVVDAGIIADPPQAVVVVAVVTGAAVTVVVVSSVATAVVASPPTVRVVVMGAAVADEADVTVAAVSEPDITDLHDATTFGDRAMLSIFVTLAASAALSFVVWKDAIEFCHSFISDCFWQKLLTNASALSSLA